MINKEVINYIKKFKEVDEELLTKIGRDGHITSENQVNKYLSYWDITIEALENQKTVIEELEKIKAKFEQYRDRWNYYGNEYERTKYETYDVCIDEIDERISELKGEAK